MPCVQLQWPKDFKKENIYFSTRQHMTCSDKRHSLWILDHTKGH